MPPPASRSRKIFWALNGLLGIAFAVEFSGARFWGIPDAVTLVLASVATVAALSRHLPLQNALPAVLVAAMIGGIAHGASANPNLAVPFGPIVFNPAAGAKIFDSVPWTIPLLWVVAIFNARGVGRIILRPWRKMKSYGFWLTGLTVVLAVSFDVALEPFASRVKRFWLWQPTKISLNWEGISILNFVGWALVSLLIMAFVTPLLIRKQPGTARSTGLQPLAIWLGALLLFVVGLARAGLWWPAGVDAVIAAITTALAVRGAKW